MAWGEEFLPRSFNFCSDLANEPVLNTDLSKPLTSFEAFFPSMSFTFDFSVSQPSKSCSKLTSTELLRVITDASLADFFTGYWAYFSKIPNLGAWFREAVGNYFGIPHFGFIKGCARISSKVYLLLGSTIKILLSKSLASWSLKESGKSNWPLEILW